MGASPDYECVEYDGTVTVGVMYQRIADERAYESGHSKEPSDVTREDAQRAAAHGLDLLQLERAAQVYDDKWGPAVAFVGGPLTNGMRIALVDGA
jgi:hypothetical protein